MLCTCLECAYGTTIEDNPNHDDSLDEHPEGCVCQDCHDAREAEKDREFDERVALGYFI